MFKFNLFTGWGWKWANKDLNRLGNYNIWIDAPHDAQVEIANILGYAMEQAYDLIPTKDHHNPVVAKKVVLNERKKKIMKNIPLEN